MKKKLSYILDLLPNNKWLRNIILTIICLHVLMIFLYISLPEGPFKFFIGFLLSPLYTVFINTNLPDCYNCHQYTVFSKKGIK